MSKRANLTNYRTSTTQYVGGTLDVATLKIDGTEVTATAAELNSLADGEAVLSRAAIAAAGADAAAATAITTQMVAVTASDGAKGVALPAAATTAYPIYVLNTVLTSGANLLVYPVSGGNDQINGGAEDAAFTMGPGEGAWFIPTSATQWYCSDKAGATTTVGEENILDGVTSTAAELNYLDLTTLGTGAASKAVVLDAGDDYTWPATGVLTYGVLKDPAATTLGATAAELNAWCDQSAGLQAVTGAVAITADGSKTKASIDSGGAYAITLAVPGAAAIGKLLCIEYSQGTTDAVTLALTNVTGGTAGTSASFNADGEGLLLYGAETKWVVIKEFGGVTLS